MKNIKIIVATACMLVAATAIADDYPSEPVRVMIPFSAGSATDTIARGLCDVLSEMWGVPVEGENLAGKGGLIATEKVAEENADGYTLLVHGAFAINPFFHTDVSYDPTMDFTHISPLATQPLALVVSPSSRVRSISALIALAKASPGRLQYGSPGTGSAAHLTAEKFLLEAGIRLNHVPFKGGPETLAATRAEEVTFSFLPLAFAKKSAAGGTLKVLGVTSVQRASALPDIPTISEDGLTGFEYNHWWGLWAPAGLADHVITRLETDVAAALQTDLIRELYAKIGADVMSMPVAEFENFVLAELETIEDIVARAGIGIHKE